MTRLAAQIESRQSETLFRFSAAASYYDLVQRRISEQREERIEGLQTFREFTERRLAPAMNTCRSVTGRLEALSVRVAQATRLLSTRVDLSSERQSQALLVSMNRRAQLQLRLQETVKGFPSPPSPITSSDWSVTPSKGWKRSACASVRRSPWVSPSLSPRSWPFLACG